jgi:hypothetical protein
MICLHLSGQEVQKTTFLLLPRSSCNVAQTRDHKDKQTTASSRSAATCTKFCECNEGHA